MSDKRDVFAHAEPMPGAIERDLTKKTLTVDIQNAMGEKFHFEIPPGLDLDAVKSMAAPRTAGTVGDKKPTVGIERSFFDAR